MSFLDNIEQIVTLYPILAFGAVFLAGVLSSASPCVLATIPLVVGFVGGYADGDRWKAFRYSMAFILGLSITFTAFGAAAGMLGTMFGAMGGWWYIVAGIVALVMGGQMMGLYEIRLPIKRAFKPKQGGVIGSFILGLFFGVVSSPCATPVLVVILTYVATKGQVLYGTALLFLRHRTLPAYAVGRHLYRVYRIICETEGYCQLLRLDKKVWRSCGGSSGCLADMERMRGLMMKILFSIILSALILMGGSIDGEAGVTNINNSELSDLLKKGVSIIDIRTEPEWRQTGIVPGSHLLMLFDEKRNVVDPQGWLAKVKVIAPIDKPVILICRVGNRTIAATQFLARSGYKEVYNVTGGIELWIRAGLPIERYKGDEQKWRR